MNIRKIEGRIKKKKGVIIVEKMAIFQKIVHRNEMKEEVIEKGHQEIRGDQGVVENCQNKRKREEDKEDLIIQDLSRETNDLFQNSGLEIDINTKMIDKEEIVQDSIDTNQEAKKEDIKELRHIIVNRLKCRIT